MICDLIFRLTAIVHTRLYNLCSTLNLVDAEIKLYKQNIYHDEFLVIYLKSSRIQCV